MSDPARLSSTWGGHGATRVEPATVDLAAVTAASPGSPQPDRAQPHVEPATVELRPPVRIIPGPDGADSPAADGGIPRHRWYAWMELAADRDAGRRSTLPVIEWALGHALHLAFPYWWLHARAGDLGWLVHVARVDPVDGGGTMLLSACLLSAPHGSGARYDVVPRDQADPAEHWDRCAVCAEAPR